jgi:hypothetical protein
MRTGSCLTVLFLVLYTSTCPAEERLPLFQPRPPATALEALERYVEQHYPSLSDKSRTGAWVAVVTGSLGSVADVGAALSVTKGNWSPGQETDAAVEGTGWLGALQGFLFSPCLGVGLADVLLPKIDLRREYGSLLDLPESEREHEAVLLAGRIVKRERQRRIAEALFTIAATAGTIGAYCLGEPRVGGTLEGADVRSAYSAGAVGFVLVLGLTAMVPRIALSGTGELRPWVGK